KVVAVASNECNPMKVGDGWGMAILSARFWTAAVPCRSYGACDLLPVSFHTYAAPLALGAECGRSRARSAAPDQKALIEPQAELPVHALRTETVRAPGTPRTLFRCQRFSGPTWRLTTSPVAPVLVPNPGQSSV
ncbi:MAG: hypothetical protein M9920_17140, partial [Verrucomicrobiae bacterium]|nr:hypothetical protein [Verrucomicrobiae bacterium]